MGWDLGGRPGGSAGQALGVPPASQLVRVRVTRVDAAGTAPVVRLEGAGADEYRVRITGARGRFVLTLAESCARGWRLRGLPAGWHATHVAIDRYANGWVVDGYAGATLTIEYQPRGPARLALAASGTAGLAALVWLLRSRWYRYQTDLRG